MTDVNAPKGMTAVEVLDRLLEASTFEDMQVVLCGLLSPPPGDEEPN